MGLFRGIDCLYVAQLLDKQFRDEVNKRLGMKKGNLKAAIEDAMRDWIGKKYI